MNGRCRSFNTGTAGTRGSVCVVGRSGSNGGRVQPVVGGQFQVVPAG